MSLEDRQSGAPVARAAQANRISYPTAVLTVAFALLVFAGAFQISSAVPQLLRSVQGPKTSVSSSDVVPGSVSATDRQISGLQDKLRTRADDPILETALASAYLQKVRETADYSYYTRADKLMRQSYDQDPTNVDTLVGLGSLALSRHQWQDGLDWGQKAAVLNPYKADVYGVIGDAQVELGRYDDAVLTVQSMVNLRPGLTSYARVSYLRELHGDLPGAIAAMRDAATIAQSLGESGSWARVQLGHLLLQTGDISGAEQEYHRALAVNPTDMLAEGGLGRARMAAGDFSGAIPHFERAFKGLPLPEFVLALGDLYEATGRPDDAARQFDLARALQQLFIAGGGNADMELALLEAERGDPTQAVDIARGEVARRQSVHAYDVLSWALYQAGDLTGAHAASQQALRLGSQDGLMLFHAGMIDARRGDRAAAIAELTKALARQPGGYAPRVYAPQADAALQQLGAAR